MEHATNTVLFIGRPGSGKGTQAKIIAEKLGWMMFSSGDRFKQIRDGNEPFSARVREMYDKGMLIPDWFADYLLESAMLGNSVDAGIILDGFGRTKDQAEHLLEIIEWLGRGFVVLNLEVSEEEVLRRMLKRSETEHRPDSDGEDKIKARLAQYDANTAPALEYFRSKGVVIDIRGEQTPEEIAAEIMNILNQHASS
jgi:adenylate kinase